MADKTPRRAITDVENEMQRQFEKWGEQNHPDHDPVLTGRAGGVTGQRLAQHHEIASAVRAKYLCHVAEKRGKLTWSHILVEEVAEAIEEQDPERLREELVQVAAVAVSWIEAIDRR